MPDTVKLDPKATADRLRPLLAKEPPAPAPDDQRKLAFLEEVCGHLDLDPNALNVSHVAKLMGEAGIEQHAADEYPKAVNGTDTRGRLVPLVWKPGHANAGQHIIFADADEETAFNKDEGVIETEYASAAAA